MNSVRSVQRFFPVLMILSLLAATPVQGQPPPGFVDMGRFIIDLEIEVRYFSTNNFVGSRIDGYNAEKLYLSREAAEALLNVQSELRQIGLGLKL
ncbi:MAG: D-alanyl-D-alanine dipeptidase, partial [Gammaproteobacteria bacterium]